MTTRRVFREAKHGVGARMAIDFRQSSRRATIWRAIEKVVVTITATTSSNRTQTVAQAVEYVFQQIFANPGNKGERLRRSAEALVFPIWTRLTDGYWTTRYAGGHLVVRRGQGASHAVYARLPDYREMTFWLGALRPGDLFVDVGANIGIYTVLLASRGCQVVAVEPADGARRLLEVNLELNDLSADIVPVALGREPGEARLTSELGSSNHLVTTSDVTERPAGSAIEVPLTTYDDLIGDRTAAGVKVDVEGFELDVMLGASRALAEQRIGVVQLEWNSMARERFGTQRDEVARVLQKADYVLARPDDRGRLRPTVPDEGPDLFAVASRLSDQLIEPDR
jgi:FkbM family methyltransferase